MASFDRLSFVLGVLALSCLAQLLTHHPVIAGKVFSVAGGFTVVEKAVSYYFKGWHLFALDFCYWVNIACVLIPTLLPVGEVSRVAYALLFLYGNGPVCIAIPIWNQSLVFHDFERIMSVGLHVWPMLFSYCVTWYPFDAASEYYAKNYLKTSDVFWCFVAYIVWQLGYFVVTHTVLSAYMKNNPQLLTSYRWIASDPSNAIHGLILQMGRGFGLFKKGEKIGLDDVRGELMFMLIQLIYTAVTIGVAGLVALGGKTAHEILMLATIASSLWNGSAVYLEGSGDDMKAPVVEVDVQKKVVAGKKSE